MNDKPGRIELGKLSVALLEHLTEPVLGEDVQEILKSPKLEKELQSTLIEILNHVEERFRSDCEDLDLRTALMDLPLGNLPSVRNAVRRFYDRPTDPLLRTVLKKGLSESLPKNYQTRIDSGVDLYLKILRQELIAVSPNSDFREKLNALVLQAMQENTAEIAHGINALQTEIQRLRISLNAHPEQSQEPRLTSSRSHPWHNLPTRGYIKFIGRHEELNKLKELVSPVQRRFFVITLDGIGGVGKSALALEYAYQQVAGYAALSKEERFEAIVWVSAKRSVLTARGIKARRAGFNRLGDLFREIAVVLEQPAILHSNEEYQAQLVLQVLSSQNTLLILDNLDTIDDEELLSFIRDDLPETTKVIITTRHRIDVSYPIRLTGMPAEEAKALIEIESGNRNIPLLSENAGDLYRYTGGIPLAIVWSIGLMSVGYGITSVLRKLGSGYSDISRFCFAESANYIRPKGSYPLLLACALFESPVSRELIGEVAGFGSDEIGRDDGLAELLQLSLLNKEADHFNMLPLTRSFALEELQSQTQLAKELRDRWLKCLVELAKPFEKHRWYNRPRSFLRREGVHLVTLLEWCQHEQRVDVILSILPALREYYDLMGLWAERINISLITLEYAQVLGDLTSVISIQVSLAWILSQQGNFSDSMAYITHAINTAKESNDISWICEALIIKAVVFRRFSKFEDALECCQQAIGLLSTIPLEEKPYANAWIDYELGLIARDRGDWDLAKEHFDSARKVFEIKDNDDPIFSLEFAWMVYSNIGYVDQQLGNLDNAEKIYLQSIDFFRNSGSKGQVATILTWLAIIEEQRGNIAAAKEYANEALELDRKLGMPKIAQNVQALLKRMNFREDSDS